MAAEIHEHAAADRIGAKAVRRRGIDHVVLGVNAAEGDQFADLAGADDLAGEPDDRVLEVVETGERHPP